MAASYPKPDGERRNRVEPKFGWTDLTPTPDVKAPKLPAWRKWAPATTKWWRELWAKPQAAMWESDGSTLWTLACLYDDLIAARADASKVSAEMRQHEDRHGLNPKAMLQLRWRVIEPAAETTVGDGPSPAADDRRAQVLRMVSGGRAS